MSDRDLVRQIRALGESLERASRWQGSAIEVDGAKDDFVYELLCYLTIAVATTSHFAVTLILRRHPKSKQLAPLFPKKPGNKGNFSFLVLREIDGQIAFELCPGILIKDRYGKRRAPDISLLCANSGDDPAHGDLQGIWDAKYVQKEASRLADTAVSDFVFTFEELGSPAPPSRWTHCVGIQAFRGSGLLTNGCHSTEPLATLTQRRIYETSGFPKKPTTRP